MHKVGSIKAGHCHFIRIERLAPQHIPVTGYSTNLKNTVPDGGTAGMYITETTATASARLGKISVQRQQQQRVSRRRFQEEMTIYTHSQSASSVFHS